jgi:hypothetical protein
VRARDPDQLVTAVGTGLAHRRDLQVLGEVVVQLAIALLDLTTHQGDVHRGVRRQAVHPGDELLDGVGHDEVLPVGLEGLDRARGALGEPLLDERLDTPAGQVGVLLLPGQGELLLDDRLGQHEPGVVVAAAPQQLERPQRVEARQPRNRQAPSGTVEPHRRRTGQDPDAVHGPDGVEVLDALDVVPHAVTVDVAGAGLLGDAEHASVHVLRDAGDHVLGGSAEALRPVGADQIVVAADAARRDDDRLSGHRELPDRRPGGRRGPRSVRRLQHLAADPGHDPVGHGELVHLVAERELDEALLVALADDPLERLDESGPGAPRDVEAGDRVAVPAGQAAAALGPADDREDAVPPLLEPAALLARREVHVRLGPAPRPQVLVAVELGAAGPVLERQVDRVLDAHASLLGRVDEEQAAERPEGLAAQTLLSLLVDQDDSAPRLDQLRGGHEPGQTSTDDDHISIHEADCVLRPGPCHL